MLWSIFEERRSEERKIIAVGLIIYTDNNTTTTTTTTLYNRVHKIKPAALDQDPSSKSNHDPCQDENAQALILSYYHVAVHIANLATLLSKHHVAQSRGNTQY